MTDETVRPTSEDTPAPPASTRWVEPPLQEDDSLASPFVPGRTGRSAADAASEQTAPFTDGAPAPEAPPQEEVRETATVEEATVEEVGPGSDEAETTAETAPDDFPFDQFNLEGDEEEQPAEAAEEPVAGMGWSPTDLDLEEAAEEPWQPEQPKAAEPEAAQPGPTEAMEALEPVSGAAEEAAAILERLARALRDDGVEGVRGEMDSTHRLTSLVASMVAGYVSGRS